MTSTMRPSASALSAAAPEFVSFLEVAKDANTLVSGGRGDPLNARFIPRNFLIEERIDAQRAGSYATALPRALSANLGVAFTEWNAAHNAYLAEHVFLKPPVTHDYNTVDMHDSSVCPETFRSSLALTAMQGADFDTYLIRVVSVDDIEILSGRNGAEIFALGERTVQEQGRTSQARDSLGHILDDAFYGPKWDHRPVFAAFYEDIADYVRNPSDTTWPDHLRNRLGLFHVNQWTRSFPHRVFLFRYKIRDLPRFKGDASQRPIAHPTVLDHRFSEAFCPSPPEQLGQPGRGRLVNLELGSKDEPVREVLHLSMPLEKSHLFRVGTISAPVPDYLGPSRRDHLVWLRLLSNRDDWAAATDSDILT